MKCKYTIMRNGGYISSVDIENDKIYVEEGNEKQVLDIDSKTCFNTLISLFSLKSSWSSTWCYKPVYQIEFENKGVKEVYEFDASSTPDNWLMFVGYIGKLVGESI